MDKMELNQSYQKLSCVAFSSNVNQTKTVTHHSFPKRIPMKVLNM